MAPGPQPAAVDGGALDTILVFLATIGLAVGRGDVDGPSAVPGITIVDGTLVLDRTRPFHPGDLLHEAGHLALLPPSQRALAQGVLPADVGAGYEVGAICWSVAAATNLGLGLAVVFHGDGYRDASEWMIETYAGPHAPGLPLLVWAGLTWAPGSAPAGERGYPHMRQWLRTSELPS